MDNQIKRMGLLERLFAPVIHESTKLTHLLGKPITVDYMASESEIEVRVG